MSAYGTYIHQQLSAQAERAAWNVVATVHAAFLSDCLFLASGMF